jgi:hypothetical protein
MAYTQDQIDRLKAALAKGATRLKMDGEEVQFASLKEMRRQIREMESEMAGAACAAPTATYPRTLRGL